MYVYIYIYIYMYAHIQIQIQVQIQIQMQIYMYVCICIYVCICVSISISIYSYVYMCVDSYFEIRRRAVPPRRMANPRSKNPDFRRFDSSWFLILRGGMPWSTGNFPEIQAQRFLVCGFSVRGLAVGRAIDRAEVDLVSPNMVS